ncbi:MAG: MazG-like family [Chloroflexota bacterium]|jgi:NTP pyrophosphatase (non-canonical NTP hydrolase)|nr:MazG-like family [Chloroflexota bacterium]
MWRLQSEVAAFDAARFQSLGPGYVALSLAGEAGELANQIKKLWRIEPRIGQPDGYSAVGETERALIADEVADVLMLGLVLANHLGIDVEAELRRKLEVIDARLRTGHYGNEARDADEPA